MTGGRHLPHLLIVKPMKGEHSGCIISPSQLPAAVLGNCDTLQLLKLGIDVRMLISRVT
jgi:hypothetical protein